MTTYIALLRAINVSGHNMIKMADLKRMFEGMGFGHVQTYIQSGNVLFTSGEEAEPLRRRIEAQILAAFGLTVPTVLRTAEEMALLVDNCPYPAATLPEGESLYVALLSEAPAAAGVERLRSVSSGEDQFRLVGREVYLLYRQPSHKSKLSNAIIEQKLGVTSTVRNWRTLTKLGQLAALSS